MTNPLNVEPRTVFNRDNIEILPGINSDCIDLIYLDPPFNKNKEFTAPIGTSAEGANFTDIFRETDLKDEWVSEIRSENYQLAEYLQSVKTFSTKYNYCYLVYMAIRLLECHRMLKDTGSIYLHCDQTMSHYLKVVMDCIFGEENFRNDIIWRRVTSDQKGSQHAPKSWGMNADQILFYTKSNKFTLNPNRKLTKEEEEVKFDKIDENGNRYYDDSAHIFSNPGMDARPNLCYEWRGFKNPHPSGWRLAKERLEEEYQKGNIVILPNGKLQRRKYPKDYPGASRGNIWTDVAPAMGNERTGYRTQKPVKLLRRIIEASSNEGDVILDPFCGCATAMVAAEQLGRRWIGIDTGHKAYELAKMRLPKEVQLWTDRDNGIHFTTIPPKRTDGFTAGEEQGYVYVIANENWKGLYKVGIAKDVKRRLNSYQTSDPHRAYRLVHDHRTTKYKEVESYIHKKFNGDHEWVSGDLEDIKRAIKEADERIKRTGQPLLSTETFDPDAK